MKKKSSALSLRDLRRDPSVVVIEKIPPISPARMKELEALSRRPDSEIDFSDIPETTDEEWRKKKKYVGLFYRPVKKSVTLRLDADLLAWFKAKGPGYQTKMNRVLREYFASHR